jgi:hypothetical protein
MQVCQTYVGIYWLDTIPQLPGDNSLEAALVVQYGTPSSSVAGIPLYDPVPVVLFVYWVSSDTAFFTGWRRCRTARTKVTRPLAFSYTKE